MSVLPNAPTTDPLPSHPAPSAYTYADLDALNSPDTAYSSPLAVIALVDMNAFFAQVEQVRLGLPPEAPVVCAQWQSLIAVSYAARKYGINRMDTIQSAQSKCPDLVVAHAAVFRKGESHWGYIEGLPSQAVHKVSLDPYRRESRKILKIFQENCDLVEKASVDESYLDLGRMVYQRVVETFPQLAADARPTGAVELPPVPRELPAAVQWVGEVVASDHEAAAHHQHQLSPAGAGPPPAAAPAVRDWDDVCMAVGSQILLHLRRLIYQELGYFTSGGLARNKLVAKVAGGYRKPDNQTVVRPRSTHRFLTNFQLNDISGMGGKMGDHIVRKLDIPPTANTIAYIRDQVPLDTLLDEIADPQLARKVHAMVRGDHRAPLSHRVEVKSMMSRKNFMARRPLETLQDAYDWIVVYAGDLYNRMIELDDESLNLSMSQRSSRDKGAIKRPKTLAVALTTTAYSSHSRQLPIPLTRSLEKLKAIMESSGLRLLKDLLDATSNLQALNHRPLHQLERDNVPMSRIKIYPVANLSLVISGFVKTNDTSLIDSYGGSGDDAGYREATRRMLEQVNNEALSRKADASEPAPKKAPLSREDKSYISKLFSDFAAQEQPRPEETPSSPPPPPSVAKPADGTYIKKLFQDFNEENTKATNDARPAMAAASRTPRPKEKSPAKSSSDDAYIKKIFQDFSEENAKPDIQGPAACSASRAPTANTRSSSDDAYIKKLFQDFNQENGNLREKTPEPTRSKGSSKSRLGKRAHADILQSLKKSKPAAESFIDKLVRTTFCDICQQKVEDVFEHNDYHIALDLSAKLNKDSSP